MKAIELNKFDDLKFNNYFKIPKSSKSVTSFINFIKITTDKKSVENSIKLLKTAESLKKKILNLKDSDSDIEIAKKLLKNTNDNLLKINDFFDTFNYLFDDSDIDEENMIKLLENLKKFKEILEYCSDYLSLYLEVQNSKKSINDSKSKSYTYEEILDLIQN